MRVDGGLEKIAPGRSGLTPTLAITCIGASCAIFALAVEFWPSLFPTGAKVIASWVLVSFFWFLAAVELSPWGGASWSAPNYARVAWALSFLVCAALAAINSSHIGPGGNWFAGVVMAPYVVAHLLRIVLTLRGGQLWRPKASKPD